MEDLPTMTIDELRAAITSYPHRLYEALEAVDKAEKAIERLNEQIEEEEAVLSPVEEAPGESNKQQNNNEDIQETLIRLDHELGMLEVRRDQIKGELELEYRRNPPPGDKVTEATVTAYVKSHPRFVEAQEWILEKQYELRKADISRRVDFTTRMAERRETRNRPPAQARSWKNYERN